MHSIPLAVTTSHRATRARSAQASIAASRWGAPLVGSAAEGLRRASTVLVFESNSVRLTDAATSVRYAHGIAALRARRVIAGDPNDPLVRIAGICRGEVVIDGTLGLGGDALVAAALAGPKGAVYGLDASVALAAFVDAGLASRPPTWPSAPLTICCGDIRSRLAVFREAVDVVLLDPMFDLPRRAHPSFSLVRQLAHQDRLDAALIEAAMSSARRAVVAKVRHQRGLTSLPPPSRTAETRTAVWAVWET